MVCSHLLVVLIIMKNYFINIFLLVENTIRRSQGYLRGGAQGLYQGGIMGCFRGAAQGFYGGYQIDDDDVDDDDHGDDEYSYYDSNSDGYYDSDGYEVYEIE